jgi:hypothetical protein
LWGNVEPFEWLTSVIGTTFDRLSCGDEANDRNRTRCSWHPTAGTTERISADETVSFETAQVSVYRSGGRKTQLSRDFPNRGATTLLHSSLDDIENPSTSPCQGPLGTRILVD